MASDQGHDNSMSCHASHATLPTTTTSELAISLPFPTSNPQLPISINNNNNDGYPSGSGSCDNENEKRESDNNNNWKNDEMSGSVRCNHQNRNEHLTQHENNDICERQHQLLQHHEDEDEDDAEGEGEEAKAKVDEKEVRALDKWHTAVHVLGRPLIGVYALLTAAQVNYALINNLSIRPSPPSHH
jgi:hypothetical protein